MENQNKFYYSTTNKIIKLIDEGKAGIWRKWYPGKFEPRPKVDNIIKKYCERESVTIIHEDKSGGKGGGCPYFDGGIPPVETDTERYYQVLLHELAHSTGTKNRLNRVEHNDRFLALIHPGLEEIIVELASLFICERLGINAFDNCLAYLKSWCRCNNGDVKPEIIEWLMPKAIEAAEYILK